MTNIKFDILPQRSAVMAGHTTEQHVLVRVQGPQLPEGCNTDRKALNLALVLDRSGSMDGQAIAEAECCAAYIIDQLTEKDRVDLVIYDNRVEVLVPSTHVVDKALFKRVSMRSTQAVQPRCLMAGMRVPNSAWWAMTAAHCHGCCCYLMAAPTRA